MDPAISLWILTAETEQRYRETKLCVYSVIAANWDGGDGKICRYTFGTILTEEAHSRAVRLTFSRSGPT